MTPSARSRPSDRIGANAFEAVSRLAAVRELTLHDNAQDKAAVSIPEPAGVEEAAPNLAADSAAQIVSRDDRDQLALAVAEIEKASAVLREADPALEIWSPNPSAKSATRKYWSIWLMIGGIWISATLVVAGATGAILYLLS